MKYESTLTKFGDLETGKQFLLTNGMHFMKVEVSGYDCDGHFGRAVYMTGEYKGSVCFVGFKDYILKFKE